jgi:hypothetical protein
LALQAMLGLSNAWVAIECHDSARSECWSWFGIFAVNIPASALVAMLLAFTVDLLEFHTQLLLSLLTYVVIGTLWWSVMLHVAIWMFSWASKKIGAKNA